MTTGLNRPETSKETTFSSCCQKVRLPLTLLLYSSTHVSRVVPGTPSLHVLDNRNRSLDEDRRSVVQRLRQKRLNLVYLLNLSGIDRIFRKPNRKKRDTFGSSGTFTVKTSPLRMLRSLKERFTGTEWSVNVGKVTMTFLVSCPPPV